MFRYHGIRHNHAIADIPHILYECTEDPGPEGLENFAEW